MTTETQKLHKDFQKLLTQIETALAETDLPYTDIASVYSKLVKRLQNEATDNAFTEIRKDVEILFAEVKKIYDRIETINTQIEFLEKQEE